MSKSTLCGRPLGSPHVELVQVWSGRGNQVLGLGYSHYRYLQRIFPIQIRNERHVRAELTEMRDPRQVEKLSVKFLRGCGEALEKRGRGQGTKPTSARVCLDKPITFLLWYEGVSRQTHGVQGRENAK